MKNGDMPAMPIPDDSESGGVLPAVALHHADCSGLTKREYFAGLAMQGILANHKVGTSYELEDVPDSAVQFADALLKRLENHNDR